MDGKQEPLPGMPPPAPPTLKNMAELMRTIDKLVPADTHGAIAQWETLIDVSARMFGDGVRFVIPLVDFQDSDETAGGE